VGSIVKSYELTFLHFLVLTFIILNLSFWNC